MSNPWMCGASMGMVFCPAADSFASNGGAGFSLIFKSWVVRDSASYALACVGVFAMGAARQLLVGARAALAPAPGAPPPPRDLVLLDSLLFAAALFLAYLNMLVAMAYELGLLAALVAGEAAVHLALALRAARKGAADHRDHRFVALAGDAACH
jgi:hypothetical protein